MKFPNPGYARFLPYGWPGPIFEMIYAMDETEPDLKIVVDDGISEVRMSLRISDAYELAPWAPTFEMALDGDCADYAMPAMVYRG